MSFLLEHPDIEPRPTVANLATVAVVAVNEDVPLSNFTMELQHALSAIGQFIEINYQQVDCEIMDMKSLIVKWWNMRLMHSFKADSNLRL